MIRSTVAVVLALSSAAVAAQTQVGVSVQVNQPGLYGRIDVGALPPAAPPPVLVYPQPVVIVPGPVTVHQRPIYLHVPPGHEKHWDKHCAAYRACGQPVYFVRDDWYREHVVRREWRDERRGPGGGRGRRHGHDRDDDHHDHDDGGRGHGHGHGRG